MSKVPNEAPDGSGTLANPAALQPALTQMTTDPARWCTTGRGLRRTREVQLVISIVDILAKLRDEHPGWQLEYTKGNAVPRTAERKPSRRWLGGASVLKARDPRTLEYAIGQAICLETKTAARAGQPSTLPEPPNGSVTDELLRQLQGEHGDKAGQT